MSEDDAMAELIDISPQVSEASAVWPGDVPFSREVQMDVDQGEHMSLSAVRTTVHVGAHADAPSHYRRGGAAIDGVSLEAYYGPCQLLDVDVDRGARIGPDDLRAPVEAERILLRTGTWPDPTHFNTDFASLSPELVTMLDAHGVRLVGIDTPSVDPWDDAALHSHHALAERGMLNLEGLSLEGVEPGRYTLIALPLRLVCADASPVRAALAPR